VSAAELPRPAPRASNVRHLVLAGLLVITSINYIQRNALGPAATTVERALGIRRELLDLANGAFFLAYTLMQVPSGWLSKRWGPRAALTVFAAGWSVAMIGCAVSRGFVDLFAARLAMGVLQAGIFPCATLILAVWYPVSQRGTATALLNSFMLFGGAISSALTAVLLEPLGWRAVFAAYAAPGLLWSAWFYWWFRNRPEEHPGVNPAEAAVIGKGRPREPAGPVPAQEAPARSASWWVVLGSLPLLLLCGQQCFRAAANRLFDSRLPTYFEDERGATRRQAGILASMPQLAGIFGGTLGGVLSDYILRRTRSLRAARRGLAMASLAAAVGLYLLAYTIASVPLATAVLSLGFFIFCFSSPCAYALTMDISGKHLAVVFGLMNMAGNLGAWVFVSSISALVRLGGWQLLLGVWIYLHLAALVCWFFLDPEIVIGEPRRKE
jgi:sugar phosphate permease